MFTHVLTNNNDVIEIKNSKSNLGTQGADPGLSIPWHISESQKHPVLFYAISATLLIFFLVFLFLVRPPFIASGKMVLSHRL